MSHTVKVWERVILIDRRLREQEQTSKFGFFGWRENNGCHIPSVSG